MIAEQVMIESGGSAPASQLDADELIALDVVAALVYKLVQVGVVGPPDRCSARAGVCAVEDVGSFCALCQYLTCRWHSCCQPV